MRKLLILAFLLPLMAWGQVVTAIQDGRYFGFAQNVEVEATYREGFLVFSKFQPIDRSTGIRLKMQCHAGGISTQNLLRVSPNGKFSGNCEVIHGKQINSLLDAYNNFNLEAQGTFPHLQVNSSNSEAGEVVMTFIPISMRSDFEQLKRQGRLTSTSEFLSRSASANHSPGKTS
jgi:hypothetical protein